MYKRVGLILISILLVLSIIGFFVESRTFESGQAFTRCLLLTILVGLLWVHMISKQKKSRKIEYYLMAGVIASGIGIYALAIVDSSIFDTIHTTMQVSATVNGKQTEVEVYSDDMLVTLSDIGLEEENTIYSCYHEVYGQFLIDKEYYSDQPKTGSEDGISLYYITYKVENSYLYNQVVKQECMAGESEDTYELIENEQWAASKIYKQKQQDTYEYIFLYKDMILELNIDADLSNQQLEKIVVKCDPAGKAN